VEANFFRCLAQELSLALCGRRIEKIHGPGEGVLVLTLAPKGPGEGKIHLIFRPAKSAGLLFLTRERPVNPPAASARVMWLRKRLQGRRLLTCSADWTGLRLAFTLSPRAIASAGSVLVLDLREELRLAEDFAAPAPPTWPELSRVLDDAEVWREFPQLTPSLRKRLAILAETSPPQAQTLLHQLESGQADQFFLPSSSPDAPPRQPLVWDDGSPGTQRFETAIAAATAYGERTLFPQLARAEARVETDQAATAQKRLRRRLSQLDADEARHAELSALSMAAEALQAALSAMPTTPHAESIVLEHPAHGPVSVPLDPRLTPAENMTRLFQLAAKGRRGLAHVLRRRAGVREEMEGVFVTVPPKQGEGLPKATTSGPALLPKRYQGLAVALFRTSDGFLVVRGKSQQANHEILSKAASPFDFWLHVAGGPSAHVILRRDFPDQVIPEQSLVEAAVLCALKSYRKDDTRADVLLAKVKDVRKVKGAAIGSVAVDEVERTLRVVLDASLEDRLAVRIAEAAPAKRPARK
jgi:predicted ribosome quality control (RQC) complex YloA/Tae2 family protein